MPDNDVLKSLILINEVASPIYIGGAGAAISSALTGTNICTYDAPLTNLGLGAGIAAITPVMAEVGSKVAIEIAGLKDKPTTPKKLAVGFFGGLIGAGTGVIGGSFAGTMFGQIAYKLAEEITGIFSSVPNCAAEYTPLMTDYASLLFNSLNNNVPYVTETCVLVTFGAGIYCSEKALDNYLSEEIIE